DQWSMVNGELERHCATFRRRATKGQCFTQPYLGCREFAASWRLVEGEELEPPILITKDLGRMLYDMDFTDPEHPKPIFFDAKMINGIIKL
ncbi:MAG: type I-E CRISPR-associated protein Cas5/CasD, partial [Rikenellaceae bacterium]